MDGTTRATRDPVGRRQAIIEAAAALIIENGINDLTHRKVAARASVPLGSTTHYFASLEDLKAAALAWLGLRTEEGLSEIARDLAAAGDWVGTLARLFHEYLGDPAQVRADTAFYVASMDSPRLHSIATRWSEGLQEILTPYTDPVTARAISAYADGATVQTMLRGSAPDAGELLDVLTRLTRTTDA
ncbi:TetR/AcrR family transcriptional regulator [Jiangella alba]|uniref:DNA-binding transcriptional regulator YbjK n=1 Tax=Jiangella alba TaxID=561176 RepID=A0A1H5CRS8_9ACTN|nr:TetR family transcriptional regulator [Jiangella alba]SED69422.1 DNA-binding transcriptional regulator YbjK [Jiangella alba]